MPTGYTSDLYDGKDVSFEDFTLSCARAFGYWVHQRDEGFDQKPRIRQVDTYYLNSVAQDKKALRDWKAMSDDEKYDQWRDYADKTEARNAEYARETRERTARFQAMHDKVEAWDAPEGLENLKTFMKEQLSYDIRDEPTPSEVMEFDEWVDNHEQFLVRSLTYSQERLDKELENVRISAQATTDLYASLGLDYKE